MVGDSTKDVSPHPERAHEDRPGAVLVYAAGAPCKQTFDLPDRRWLLGRADFEAFGCPDSRVSRQHALFVHERGGWTVTDLGSRNGTFVNGARIDAPTRVAAPRVVRVGDSLILLGDDIAPFLRHPVQVAEAGVTGPALHGALERVRRLASSAETLLITGESGVGKELAARTFHEAGRFPGGPLVAVNCATIPDALAERLLFGAVRGAYSGASSDAVGYIRAADRGTLFLDEVVELSPAVQAKLLRVLESRDVMPLGATSAQTVSTRFCFATLANLHAAVRAEKFRADLYFRIAGNAVSMPPLRERVEEIPWLVSWALGRAGGPSSAHASLVESLLLRPWPGNVRELLSTVRAAAEEARLAGSPSLTLAHLQREDAPAEAPRAVRVEDLTADQVRRAIDEQRGNLTAVARALGVHRSQLYKLLKRLGLER